MTPEDKYHVFERNLALEMARVTEASALAAAMHLGRGDERAAARAASRAMRTALNGVGITGRVIFGDHDPGLDEEDDDGGLGDGVSVGTQDGPEVEVAAHPLEGATICATGMPNSLSLLAMAESGGFIDMPPDLYMEKIAVGPRVPDGVLSLEQTPAENVQALARLRQADPSDLVVCILDRPRNENLIGAVRTAGARIQLIQDGDVSGIMATTDPRSGVDMLMGSGGAREGVLSAAALACMGGWMQGRLIVRSEADRAALRATDFGDPDRILALPDMVKGDVMFAATGVTDGAILRGVRVWPGGASTHSMVARSTSGTVRRIESRHDLRRKAALARSTAGAE
ncbi:fructose-bisphosphatase class II family protein [Roseospira marina]|uniref:Fructose-1,6-bisphosphatase n=1 Tax=Roseospira marina TaxID=140057 RepID=A0A5M6IG58_9PROT|nr:fructose-bisphosphatase class II family protein [Roseospira marina]KAA5607243.1 fructose-bisphosphatase class II family protein [Roseospira marina]MBB4312605.1 fructose-1,6-bisphosphatase II / sedoheptulose-1,7-bisphosphatase [Roseospira marina]MBB5085379.1 fructose-1,6-bisphosphatase II / sedoheptulose-1,7-bisphosphatase [Roseospira marina]